MRGLLAKEGGLLWRSHEHNVGSEKLKEEGGVMMVAIATAVATIPALHALAGAAHVK